MKNNIPATPGIPTSFTNFFQKEKISILYLCILILVVIFLRIPFLDVPLERDEGEYAYGAQLLLKGYLPYVNFYNMKLPGMYLIYSILLELFGMTHRGIHTGLLIVIIMSIVTIYLLARNLSNTLFASITATTFAILTLDPGMQGIIANSEHFMNFFILLALLLISYKKETNNYFYAAGILLGLALIIKQHAIFAILFSAILFWQQQNSRATVKGKFYTLLLFFLSVFTPVILIATYYFMNGYFHEFRLWTFDYAIDYVSQIPLSLAGDVFIVRSLSTFSQMYLIWIFILLGLVLSAIRFNADMLSRYLLLFAVFSFLSIIPGFYFRPHYYLLLIPAASLTSGYTAISIKKFLGSSTTTIKNGLPVLVYLALVAFTFNSQRDYLFRYNPIQVSRFLYGSNPFPESIQIAEFIAKATGKKDKILILGSEPQILFYARRQSASGFFYMFPLMENHKNAIKMQKLFIREVENNNPSFAVVVNIPFSWQISPESELHIVDWSNKYINKNFYPVAILTLRGNNEGYEWHQYDKKYTNSNFSITLFKHR